MTDENKPCSATNDHDNDNDDGINVDDAAEHSDNQYEGMPFENRQSLLLQNIRSSVKCFKKLAKEANRKADDMLALHQKIAQTDLQFSQSVAHDLQKSGVEISLLTFLFRNHRVTKTRHTPEISPLDSIARISRVAMSEFADNDDENKAHYCNRTGCPCDNDFILLILSNYRSTGRIRQLIDEWKKLGDRGRGQRDSQFKTIFEQLDEELAKDKKFALDRDYKYW